MAISVNAVLAGAVFLLPSLSGVGSSVLAPFVGPQPVQRPSDGFAISLPLGWEHTVAADADPDDWWDEAKVGDVGQHHAAFLDGGGVLMARQTSEFAHSNCFLSDISDTATMWPAYADVSELVDDVEQISQDAQEFTSVGSAFMDLSSGRVGCVDRVSKDGWDSRIYLFTDGRAWFDLECGARHAPEDRWLSIAETFEFLSESAQG